MSTSFTEGEKMCLSQKVPKKNLAKENKGTYLIILFIIYNDIDDQKYLLRLMMNDMKKNLDFIDRTNWMFTKDNFDIHFLNK